FAILVSTSNTIFERKSQPIRKQTKANMITSPIIRRYLNSNSRFILSILVMSFQFQLRRIIETMKQPGRIDHSNRKRDHPKRTHIIENRVKKCQYQNRNQRTI